MVSEIWYRLSNFEQTGKDEISAEAVVPDGSPWFDGHFPEEPVLPAIAQLGMVFDLLFRVLGVGFRILEIKRVRFRQLIRPGERIVLVLSPGAKDPFKYGFHIHKNGKTVCNGFVTVERVQTTGI